METIYYWQCAVPLEYVEREMLSSLQGELKHLGLWKFAGAMMYDFVLSMSFANILMQKMPKKC